MKIEKIYLLQFLLALLLILNIPSFGKANWTKDNETQSESTYSNGYSEVNGINMYYEIYGEGSPLVLIHGGGSTIQTSFSRIIPQLSKSRKIIAVELQAHGRTGDRETPLSFEQDADDVVMLLNNLKIEKADFLGFSNGGTTVLQIAIRHPEKANRIILCSALSKRNGVPDQFWEFMKHASVENAPQELKTAYKEVAENPENLEIMLAKDAERMVNFKDIPDEQLQSIEAPAFIIGGDKDVILPEHEVEMYRLLPNLQLAIIPGGHGEYLGEITTLSSGNIEGINAAVSLIEEFLNKQNKKE